MVALGLLATAVALFCIFALIPSQRRNPSGIPNPIDPAHRDAVTVDEAGNNAVPPRRSVADEGAFQLVEASSGMQTDEGANGNGNGNGYPAIYGVKVLGMSNHDSSAFTQGFFHERACEGGGGPCEEYILESTGNIVFRGRKEKRTKRNRLRDWIQLDCIALDWNRMGLGLFCFVLFCFVFLKLQYSDFIVLCRCCY